MGDQLNMADAGSRSLKHPPMACRLQPLRSTLGHRCKTAKEFLDLELSSSHQCRHYGLIVKFPESGLGKKGSDDFLESY